MSVPGADHVQPVIVTLPVEIDAVNYSHVCEQLQDAVTRGGHVVIADLTATTFCDSAGFRVLTRTHNLAVDHGVQFRLAITPGGIVTRMLRLLELEPLLDIYPSLDAARLARPGTGE